MVKEAVTSTLLDKLRAQRQRRRGTPAASPSFRRAPEDGAPTLDMRPGRPSAASGDAQARPNAPAPLPVRIVNQWWNRLLEAVYHGSLSGQEAEYASHSTGRDYLWNTVGTSVWGMTFPILTVVTTQLVGPEQAGMFSMAFVAGTLLMILANYGLRNYQASDIDEHQAFSSYQVNRWITCAIALVVGALYCALRDYDPYMATLSMGVYLYKIVDGAADVFEGRLQQSDKLYLAGISQTVRSVAAIAAFSALLLLTRSLAVAGVAIAVAAIASLVLVTVPLALLETEKSRPPRAGEVWTLMRHGLPLFAALFLFNLIESAPKFVMEGSLSYDNQLYFNALYFPAQGILLTIGFIYKPQLLRLASIWANPKKRRRFDVIIVAVIGVVVLVTAGMLLVMGSVGIPVMSFMYGEDFEQFRLLAYLMVAAGGVTAAIDFLYAVVTVLRRQQMVMRLYLVSFIAAVASSLVLVNLLGLTGAVVSYLATMTLLLVLLVLEYVRMRHAITRERNPFR